MTEYHKRFDPIYSDARNRIRGLGPFSYYYSYMAQQKQQLVSSWRHPQHLQPQLPLLAGCTGM